jgi:hypothetical protein
MAQTGDMSETGLAGSIPTQHFDLAYRASGVQDVIPGKQRGLAASSSRRPGSSYEANLRRRPF